MSSNYGTMTNDKQNHPFFYTANDLNRANGDDAGAEASLFNSLEDRRTFSRGRSGEKLTAAVSGERAPMDMSARTDEVYNLFDASNTGGNSISKRGKLKNARFKNAVNRTMAQKRSIGMFQSKLSESMKNVHKRNASSQVHHIMDLVSKTGKTVLPENPFAGSQGRDDDSVDSVDKINRSKTQTDRLVAGAFQVQKLFEDDNDQSTSSQTTTESPLPIEELPLLSGVLDGEVDPTDENAGLSRRRKQKARRIFKMLHRKLRRLCRTVAQLICFVCQGIAAAYFAFAAIPLVMTAWILFYNLGNPRFDFLPRTTTLSWWCNFFARQLLTLELARMTQFFLIDGLTLRTKFTITVGGPLVTLLMIQAKGWPFLLFAWSVIDLLILHGDDPFAVNWLYWTGLRIFSPGVSGAYLINSDVYYHALMCLVFSGVVTSLKRTFMAVHFGRKTLGRLKKRVSLVYSQPFASCLHLYDII
jgi:hypothetical protein